MSSLKHSHIHTLTSSILYWRVIIRVFSYRQRQEFYQTVTSILAAAVLYQW